MRSVRRASAVAQDGRLVPDPHERVRAAAGLERSERVHGMLGTLKQMLAEVRPDSAGILCGRCRDETLSDGRTDELG